MNKQYTYFNIGYFVLAFVALALLAGIYKQLSKHDFSCYNYKKNHRITKQYGPKHRKHHHHHYHHSRRE